MKKSVRILVLAFALIMLLSVPVGAFNSYQSYTYSINGEPLLSPDAYIPVAQYGNRHMLFPEGIELTAPQDMVVDDEGNVYIADSKLNAVVVLDRNYKYKFMVSAFTNEIGAPDTLAEPEGVFVTDHKKNGYGEIIEAGKIYVCDTKNSRIVVFSREGDFLYVLDEPKSELFSDDSVYRPVAMAVDQYNRIYVASPTTPEGIIVLTSEGEFTGFIGAQEVTISPWDIIWKRFQTEKQKKLSEQRIPAPYSNISINDDGFVFAISASSDLDTKVENAIRNKEATPNASQVKLLNNAGSEIMRRNGFYPPVGEIAFTTLSRDPNAITGVSKVGDVAVGESGTWSISDTKRSKIFTYDNEGNLLFAFGDMGNLQLGNVSTIKAIAYQGERLLVLDSGANKSITVYERTGYGDILYKAVTDQINREYDKAIENWTEILMRNSNFDAAYIGIGQALYRSGQYEAAMEHFEAAYDTENWSLAYAEIRKEIIEDIFIWIPIVIIALCLGLGFVLRKIAKINTRVATSGEKITYGKELLYGFHVMMHPFDGFWDLKHEKRGSVRAAITYLAITVLAFYYQSIGQGYLFNPQGTYSIIFVQLIGVLVPVMLFVVANWCLTTLFEGEGSFKDVFIATSYSLLPLPLILIPATIASTAVISTEKDIVNLFITFAFIWVGFLLIFGVMVTHDYSLGKNMITLIGTIVGMVFIMFVALLFTTLLGKIVGFISNIIVELSYRM
ncbi:MAG: YIP1 family protein [Clostridia bacterium]|nr:YIP1 family protein [Clostridia bacterium]